MKIFVKIAVITALMGLLAMPVLAFEREQPKPDREQPRPERERMEKIRQKMEFLRNWKLMDELKLDEAAASKFFSTLKSYDERDRKLMDEGFDLVKQLKNAIDQGKNNEKELQSLINKMRANLEAQQNLKLQRLDAVKGLLTIEQQAKYVLFELNFKREMIGLAGKAMNRMPKPMDHGGPQGEPEPMFEGPEE